LPTTVIHACLEEATENRKATWRSLKLKKIVTVPNWTESLGVLLGGLQSWNFGWVSQKISTKSFSYYTSIAVLQLEDDVPIAIVPSPLRNKSTLQVENITQVEY
jgi:hypothetical protein